MSFIPYLPSVYNIDYDRIKELSNRIYIQREKPKSSVEFKINPFEPRNLEIKPWKL